MKLTPHQVRDRLAEGYEPKFYTSPRKRECGYFLVTRGKAWTAWAMERVPMEIAKRKWFQELVEK